MASVSEEKVRYLVDHINDEKMNFVEAKSTDNQITYISEIVDSIHTVWDTIGGIQKVHDLKATTEAMKTTKLPGAVEQVMNSNVSYTKTTITHIY